MGPPHNKCTFALQVSRDQVSGFYMLVAELAARMPDGKLHASQLYNLDEFGNQPNGRDGVKVICEMRQPTRPQRRQREPPEQHLPAMHLCRRDLFAAPHHCARHGGPDPQLVGLPG